MKAVWFRVIDADGIPTGHIGFAMGRVEVELFWAIDEFVDPYSVEVKRAKVAGFCFKAEENEEDVLFFDQEITGVMPLPSEDGWEKPEWPEIEQIYAREV